jgi:hypothetical protein
MFREAEKRNHRQDQKGNPTDQAAPQTISREMGAHGATSSSGNSRCQFNLADRRKFLLATPLSPVPPCQHRGDDLERIVGQRSL